MESLENHLIDTENGIIKLLDPPFNKTKLEPGYIKAYLPGVRENGGQYTHAAMWAIIAFAKLGFGDKALEYYRMINPIEHTRTKEATIKYSLGRNKYEKYSGIIKETYSKIFLFETNGIKKSFSYADVLTKNVKISIKT